MRGDDIWIVVAVAAIVVLLFLTRRRKHLPDEAISPDRRGPPPDPFMGDPISRGLPNASLSFEYADGSGVVTERTIVNWIEYERHFEGYCLTRKAHRTFRKDRVLRWGADA